MKQYEMENDQGQAANKVKIRTPWAHIYASSFSRVLALLLILLSLSSSMQTSVTARTTAQIRSSTANYAVRASSLGGRTKTVSFSGLGRGIASSARNLTVLTFSLFGRQSPIALDGQAIRLPVRFGRGNTGSLSILFDKGINAAMSSSGNLSVLIKNKPLKIGESIHLGRAVLALERQPLEHERLTWRPDLVVETYLAEIKDIVNGRDKSGTLVAAGFVSQTGLLLSNRSDRLLTVDLSEMPQTMEVRSDIVSENLRFISSDTKLPENYIANLSRLLGLPGVTAEEEFMLYSGASTSLQAMLAAAALSGVRNLDFDRGFRSAALQRELFNRRLTRSKADSTILDPLAATRRRIAEPNGSEHQAGLAFDVLTRTARGLAFGRTTQYRWLKDNSWRYGFVVRYPEGSEAITGVMYEPWHFRWVGVPVAAWLYREDRVFDELVAEVKLHGSLWLGETAEAAKTEQHEALYQLDKNDNGVWLLVAVTEDITFLTDMSAQAVETSAFLADRNAFLIKMSR